MIQPNDPEFRSVMVQWWLRITRSGPVVDDLESGSLDPLTDWLTASASRSIYAYPTEIWSYDELRDIAQKFYDLSGRRAVIVSALQITVIINTDILSEIEIPGLYLAYLTPKNQYNHK